jgi:hypothetical protein
MRECIVNRVERVFEIEILPLASQSSIKCNGIDISNAVRSIEVVCEAGDVTRVTLHLLHKQFVVVKGAIETLQVTIPDEVE